MTPTLLGGLPFYAFPKLGKVIVMIDRDGDENYQPMVVPLEGGIPEPLFPQFAGMQCVARSCGRRTQPRVARGRSPEGTGSRYVPCRPELRVS